MKALFLALSLFVSSMAFAQSQTQSELEELKAVLNSPDLASMLRTDMGPVIGIVNAGKGLFYIKYSSLYGCSTTVSVIKTEQGIQLQNEGTVCPSAISVGSH